MVSPTTINNLFKIQIQQNWMCLKESYRNGDPDSASCKLRGDPISNSLHMYVVCFSALKLWELSTNQYRYARKPYNVTSNCPTIPDSSGSQRSCQLTFRRSWFIEPFFKESDQSGDFCFRKRHQILVQIIFETEAMQRGPGRETCLA